MKTMNLFTLTRADNTEDFSRLLGVLSGSRTARKVSAHEAATLRSLTNQLAAGLKALLAEENAGGDWLKFLDGFWFSYTIAHISKEFDLLKFSENGDYVLNIELKSEAIEEDRIKKQLEQNRYYLSNVSRTIYSYTYVMENNTLYYLNSRNYLKVTDMSALADTLRKPAFELFVTEDLDRYFRASDYLISPVGSPERLLQGKYFLTNQQWDFRRLILSRLQSDSEEPSPIISIAGIAGTGKTLLLFDLALVLSKKKRVLFLHGAPLLKGHLILDERLKKVWIISATEMEASGEILYPADWDYLLIDEANRISPDWLEDLLRRAQAAGIPCILTHDPHSMVEAIHSVKETEAVIESCRTQSLEFTGNIRINRPMYSFMRALFSLRDSSEGPDYSAIEILYADSEADAEALISHYQASGFEHLRLEAETAESGTLLGAEYEKVLLVMDRTYYYDADGRLCTKEQDAALLSLLYEGILRTKEALCILVKENKELFSQLLKIRI